MDIKNSRSPIFLDTTMSKDLTVKTLEELNKIYKPGLYKLIHKRKPNLLHELNKIESKLNVSKKSLTNQELKILLRIYWDLHVRMLKEYDKYEQKRYIS